MNEEIDDFEEIVVYGNLLKGERNEEWCGTPNYRQPCAIHGILLDTGWGYPSFIPNIHEKEVYAEIVKIAHETLKRLEILEGYPELYKKEKIMTRMLNNEEKLVSIYILKETPVGSVEVKARDWRNRDRTQHANDKASQ